MSSAVIPQWKVALQQKLDKKKEDERRKLQEEEQRRLDAMPPWKRMGMAPKSVIIISGGTKTVSKLQSESRSLDEAEQVEPSKKEIKSGYVSSGSSSSTTYRNENQKNAGNLQHNHVVSTEKKLANHVGVDEHDGAKEKTIAARDGVDEEHVVSVFDNPFLRHDGGMRKRKVSPVLKTDNTKGSNSVPKQPELQTVHNDVSPTITETQPRESVIMTKKEPENSIRQRSRSASPRRAAKAHGIDLKFAEAEEMPEPRVRKNSVSDLRNKFGRPASVGDLSRVSRKLSESDDSSPRSPRSPTAILDRTKLFSSQPQTVHFSGKSDSPSRLSPTTVPAPSKVTVSNSTSNKQSNSLQGNTSKQSEIKPINPPEPSKVAAVSSNVVTPKRQAPKPPTTTDPGVSRKISPPTTTDPGLLSRKISPPTTTDPGLSRKISPPEPQTDHISPTPKSQSVEKPELTGSNKPVETSNNSSTTNHTEQADQPKTAIVVGDGQSSLRRKRGTGKMSASALISLSTDNNSQDPQLSEHNSRVRAARQEARASSSKNLLRSARDAETKDTETIPSGAVSSNIFGQKKETKENHSTSDSTPKEEAPYDDVIPYPSNFRQPKQESTYVDTIPYPSNFRQPKSQTKETLEEKEPPPIKLVSYSRSVTETIEEIPRTNIDDVTLSPVKESPNLVNGSVEEKAPPRKLKKTPGKEWVGYNTPAGKPSALKKTLSILGHSDSKKLKICFNDSNLTEVFEYQSESSLLDEYLREERGINGNPRVGNLPRQEAKVEEDDDVDLEDLSVPSAKNDNVLAHEGLQSYTPKDMQNFSPSSFRQQQQQQRSAPTPKEEDPPPTADEPDPDGLAITYDDSGDYFSSAGSGSAALLF